MLTMESLSLCYLVLGKNISFARFTLILQTVILNEPMSTGTLALLLMMNVAGDHTLLRGDKECPFSGVRN